jgi:hypothetical protein
MTTVLACRPSLLIQVNRERHNLERLGASAPTERLGSSQERHSKSSHCLESAQRISSVNAEAATTNGGLGTRPLSFRLRPASRDRILPACNARIRRRDELASTRSCDNLPHLSRACVPLAHTCFLMSGRGQTVFLTGSSVKRSGRPVTLMTSCRWERSLSMIRAQLTEPG